MTETKTQFENQVNNLSSTESWGGQADYLYFRHENPKEGSLPVLVAGGWSEGTQSLRDTAEVIYKDGREVILVDHARKGGPAKNETDYNPEVAQKAQTLLNIIKELGLEQVDAVAHSEGALNTVLAANLYPDKFRNIVLVAPAGLLGEDSLPRLIGRFIPKIIRGYRVDMKELKARDEQSAKRFAASGPKFIKANPAKAMREVSALAHTQIDSALQGLRDADIKVGLIQSEADKGFPAARIEKQVIDRYAQSDTTGFTDLDMKVDAYASIASKEAGHDDLIIHPDRSTGAALQMLEKFEGRLKTGIPED
jgi:pimeloyl-ACP methyl ester carboxylesterase